MPDMIKGIQASKRMSSETDILLRVVTLMSNVKIRTENYLPPPPPPRPVHDLVNVMSWSFSHLVLQSDTLLTRRTTMNIRTMIHK